MQIKTCPAAIKAAGPNEGTEEGVFEAIVATYDVDSVGDRIIPGAFSDTLAEWKSLNRPIPVLWSHKSDDPDYHIGFVEDAEERPEGLWVKARLDLDEPKSAKVYKLLKGRRVSNFSFAYDELDARPAPKDDSGAKKDLHRLKLYEVGPTLVGCNQATSLVDVKHDEPTVAVTKTDIAPQISGVVTDLKTTGVLSKDSEDALNTMLANLAAGMEAIADVLAAVPEKATPTQPADVPAPEAKDDVPARSGTASVTAFRDRIQEALFEGGLVVDHY